MNEGDVFVEVEEVMVEVVGNRNNGDIGQEAQRMKLAGRPSKKEEIIM